MDKFKKMLSDALVLALLLEHDKEVPYRLQTEVKYLIAVIEDMEERMCS